MLKKIAKISAWVIVLVAWLILSGFVNNKYHELPLDEIEVSFEKGNVHKFITEGEVMDMLSSSGIVSGVTIRNEFDILKLESKFLSHPGVEKAEVFFVNNGKLILSIKKRNPIGRVITTVPEKNFYIDDKGLPMRLCSTYVAKVPVFSGYVDLPESINILVRDSIKELPIVKTIFQMSELINNDSFLKSQIVQIHINNNGYFELIPRIGNQRIMFGRPENMEKKFKKIKLFYTNGPSSKELRKYDTLNVIYKNQIICSKIN
jgi:cell division protein FtsQ